MAFIKNNLSFLRVFMFGIFTKYISIRLLSLCITHIHPFTLSDIALIENNAKVGAEIACRMSELQLKQSKDLLAPTFTVAKSPNDDKRKGSIVRI